MPAKLEDIVHSDPEILGGTPVFVGTRVPVKNLLDYMQGSDTLEDFLVDFLLAGNPLYQGLLAEAGITW
jgi:uncharacterized protein (DUF433 family)